MSLQPILTLPSLNHLLQGQKDLPADHEKLSSGGQRPSEEAWSSIPHNMPREWMPPFIHRYDYYQAFKEALCPPAGGKLFPTLQATPWSSPTTCPSGEHHHNRQGPRSASSLPEGGPP